MKKEKYYFLSATTIYDGFEFYGHMVCKRQNLTLEQAEKEVDNYFRHDNTKEIELFDFKEITENEYNVLKRFI